jgi:lysophospholipase L1-like esterase
MKRITILCVALCACSADGDPAAITQPPATRAGAVVFLGDSITQLCPWDTYVPGAINAGVSGNETGQMLARFDADVLAHEPSVLVMLGGTNDIRHLDSADTANLFAIVARAKAADIRVIVATLPPAELNLGAYPEVELQLFEVLNDKIVKGSTENGYDVVDYHKAMSLPGDNINTTLYADRWLHPNEAGCAAMFGVLEPILTQLR